MVPLALVERSALATLVMARFVVVPLVRLKVLPVMRLFTVSAPLMRVEPVFDMEKSVEVEKFEVVLAMLNTMPLFGVPVALVRMEMRPNGDVVPIPNDPDVVKVLVPVAPKLAFDAVSPPLKLRRVEVALLGNR